MNEESTILVVDDDPATLRALDRVLRAHGFNTVPVGDPSRARELMELLPLDAIVCDLSISVTDGKRFVASAAAAAHQVPIVVVTGHSDLNEITLMLEGSLPRAILPKPVSAERLISTLVRVLALASRNDDGDVGLTRELAQSMARALALRDVETEAHARRVAMWARRLATKMGLEDGEVFWIEIGGLLHDIGKIGVPDAILKKPGSLDDQEWVLMRRHSELGAALLEPIRRLRSARDVVLHHHESWNGRGYPAGLAGDAIPLAARIFSPIDAYDAMTSDRPYRTGMQHEKAISNIVACSGTQFDPHVVDALVTIERAEWLSVRQAVDGLVHSSASGPPAAA